MKVDKYDKWQKISDEYFKTVTKEQILKDSLDAGIIITPKKDIVPGQKKNRIE